MTPAETRKLHRGLKAMENYDRQLGFELAKLLDAALPLLRAKADREAIAEEGKAMRQITHQRRYEAARRAVAAAADVFGYQG